MTFLAALWSRFAGYVTAAGALIAAIFAIWWNGRQTGKALMKEEQERHRQEAIARKRKLDDEVDALGPTDVDRDFQRWVRKERG
jgi:hypothetical protein